MQNKSKIQNSKKNLLKQMQDHSGEALKLQELLQISRRDTQSKDEKIAQLQAQIRQQDDKIESIQSKFYTQMEQMVLSKNEEVKNWMQHSQNLEKQVRDLKLAEKQNKNNIAGKNERKMQTLSGELTALRDRNRELETVSSSSVATEKDLLVLKLTQENQELRKVASRALISSPKKHRNSSPPKNLLSSPKNPLISSSHQRLQETITESARREETLTKELESSRSLLEKTTSTYDQSLQKVSKTLSAVSLDLSQFCKIMEVVKGGHELTLNQLLGIHGSEGDQKIGDSPLEVWVRETDGIKNNVIDMRNMLSDIYAQKLGTTCITQ